MRIALSSRQFLPILGGSIQYACMLARAFRELGADVCILTRTAGGETEFAGIPVYRNAPGTVARQIAKWADVLLQVDASWRDVLPFVVERVPWFPTVHLGWPERVKSLKHLFDLVGLYVAFRNRNSIAVSDAAKRSWSLSAEAIPNPYDDSIFHRRGAPPMSERPVDILYVGRIERSKGVFHLAEAVQKLSRPDLVCCVVGDGPELAALKMACGVNRSPSDDGGSCEQVEWRFIGRQEPGVVAALMRESKILVLPTTPDWVEASPLVVMEALACGCRIVASDSGGTRENVGPDAVLVTPGNVEQLMEALEHTLAFRDDMREWDKIDAFLEQRKLHAVAMKYMERFREVLKKRARLPRVEALPMV